MWIWFPGDADESSIYFATAMLSVAEAVEIRNRLEARDDIADVYVGGITDQPVGFEALKHELAELFPEDSAG